MEIISGASTLICVNETLLEIALVQGLNKPSDQKLRFLRDWLVDAKMGKGEIQGRQGRTWNAKDLVVLKGTNGERAPFSAWVSGSVLRFFDRIWGFEHKVFLTQVFVESFLTPSRVGHNK